ncbi:RagB/SusD family nutrient uptake outer membrane protein [Galbibacter mesophilus]|uniref:RagB/SusD family nutrient uptake outer membrane protein n=1 Tax=Galbibacter mesophilus TaxID=379069 RepID=UPI00191E6925|nr:RagB/SusD family nutrient uptake outer membrane protein [Galbibacter mesophilus]MCM5661883.1 RagB/SusD family nutrient uptake outer membrane protein [Galbibacter mesophilus]
MKNILCLLWLIALFFGCSKDEKEEIVSTSLNVILIDQNGIAVPDAEITTEPSTRTMTTDENGEVFFSNINEGDYVLIASIIEGLVEYRKGITIKTGIENEVVFIIDLIDPNPPTGPGEAEIEGLINDIYQQLKGRNVFDASGYVSYWGDVGTDLVSSNFYAELDRYSFDSGTPIINYVWESHYNLIAGGINKVLKHLEDIETNLSSMQLKQKAELQFLRGLLYFNMVRLYGNPIVVTEDDYGQPDTSTYAQGMQEAYDLIISDLQFAKSNLPSISTSSRASKEAATALLGKVYLQSAGFPMLVNENYNKAIQQFEEIEGKFSLSEDYSALFNSDLSGNPEVIFKVDFKAENSQGGNYGVLWGPLGYALYDFFQPTPKAINGYFQTANMVETPVSFPIETADTRFYQNIATFKVESGQKTNLEDITNWRPYKYKKDIATPIEENGGNLDFIILRYADILLMKAEAINAISGPNSETYSLVNEVRKRAYSDEMYPLPQGLSKQEFLEVIMEERSKEFFMEGHRKDDLIRNQMLEEVLNDYNAQTSGPKKIFKSHNYIWPIPAKEFTFNPSVKQNPGY